VIDGVQSSRSLDHIDEFAAQLERVQFEINFEKNICDSEESQLLAGGIGEGSAILGDDVEAIGQIAECVSEIFVISLSRAHVSLGSMSMSMRRRRRRSMSMRRRRGQEM
jgi:hypothetical protein